MAEAIQVIGEIPSSTTILEKGSVKGNYILQMRGTGPFLVCVTHESFLEDNAPEFTYCEGNNFQFPITHDGFENWVIVTKSASPTNIEVQHRIMRTEDVQNRGSYSSPSLPESKKDTHNPNPNPNLNPNPNPNPNQEAVGGVDEKTISKLDDSMNSVKVIFGILAVTAICYIVYNKFYKKKALSRDIFDV